MDENIVEETTEKPAEAPEATVESLQETVKDLTGKNTQLFERTKKAEGFEKQEDGSWIKVEKAPVTKKETKKPEAKVEEKETTEEFGMLEITFLNSESIKGEDETQFVKKQLEEAGLTKAELPKLLQNKYFQASLETFRAEKSVADATSGVKGAGGDGNSAKNTAQYWNALGKYPTAEELPDRKERAKVARHMMAKEKGTGDPYYNSKK